LPDPYTKQYASSSSEKEKKQQKQNKENKQKQLNDNEKIQHKT
jgi:hypothetical protein